VSEKSNSNNKTITRNRRASYEYHFIDKFDAGMVLTGTEVKSLRAGNVNLVDSFVEIKNEEAWLKSLYISPFKHGNIHNHEPTRPRKLLLHRKEIDLITRGLEAKGLTVVPIELYFSRGLAKCKIALARGKKVHDKRAAIQEKDSKRMMDRELKKAREGGR
jgi:SsrA-binding protein